MGPIFKYFLLSSSFNWEGFLKGKKNHSLFTFHVLSALRCLYFTFYKACFPFLGSFDQKLEFGKCLHPSFPKAEPISLARHPEANAAKRVYGGVWAWVWHIRPPSPGTCPQQPGTLGGAGALLALGRAWGVLWAQICELGHWKTAPFQRLFTALGRELSKRQLLCKSSLLWQSETLLRKVCSL